MDVVSFSLKVYNFVNAYTCDFSRWSDVLQVIDIFNLLRYLVVPFIGFFIIKKTPQLNAEVRFL